MSTHCGICFGQGHSEASCDSKPRAVLRPVNSDHHKIRELEKRVEELELIASYARDVIDFWPLMTMRTIRVMIPKMDSLKQALELAKK